MAESLDKASFQCSVFSFQAPAETGCAARITAGGTTAGGTLGTLLAIGKRGAVGKQQALGKQRERLEPAMAGQDESLREVVESITQASRNPRRREPSPCEQNAP
jgi:hypothetical protein